MKRKTSGWRNDRNLRRALRANGTKERRSLPPELAEGDESTAKKKKRQLTMLSSLLD